LDQEQGCGDRRKRPEAGGDAVADCRLNVGIDRFEYQSINVQWRCQDRRGTSQRDSYYADRFPRVFASRESDCGANVVSFQVTGGDRFAGTLPMRLKVDQHGRVARVVKHSSAIQHRQPRTTNSVQQHNHALAGFALRMPSVNRGTGFARNHKRRGIQFRRRIADRPGARRHESAADEPGGHQPGHDQAQRCGQGIANDASRSNRSRQRSGLLVQRTSGVAIRVSHGSKDSKEVQPPCGLRQRQIGGTGGDRWFPLSILRCGPGEIPATRTTSFAGNRGQTATNAAPPVRRTSIRANHVTPDSIVPPVISPPRFARRRQPLPAWAGRCCGASGRCPRSRAATRRPGRRRR